MGSGDWISDLCGGEIEAEEIRLLKLEHGHQQPNQPELVIAHNQSAFSRAWPARTFLAIKIGELILKLLFALIGLGLLIVAIWWLFTRPGV